MQVGKQDFVIDLLMSASADFEREAYASALQLLDRVQCDERIQRQL